MKTTKAVEYTSSRMIRAKTISPRKFITQNLVGLFTFILMAMSYQSHAALVTNILWMSPTAVGVGDGSSSNNAARFDNYKVNLPIQNGTNSDLTIFFLPGDYMVGGTNKGHPGTSEAIYITGSASTIVRFIGIPDSNGNRPRLYLGLPENTGDTQWPNSTPKHQWLIRSGANFNPSQYFYSKRIVIENLILDGSFGELGAWTSEANAGGYKSYAIDVYSETGRIKNVQVRRFGSVSRVPISYLDNFGGTEAFPVAMTTYDEGQTPLEGDTHPWVIEDVELTDFGSVHAGYGTMIMPHCHKLQNGSLSDSPMVIVRRCQIRANPQSIGLGTAGGTFLTQGTTTNHFSYNWSGRIHYQDNVILNTGTGFNTDTGAMGPLTFTNNAFLDTVTFGSMGVAENFGTPSQNGYAFRDNIVRLVGRNYYKSYGDVCLDDPNTAMTNPNLGLGRQQTNSSIGVTYHGRAGDVYYATNYFTTWPLDSFYRPAPGNSNESTFRIIWKIPENTPIDCTTYARPRFPVTNMVHAGNTISTIGYDFGSPTSLSSGTYSSYTTNTASDWNNPRSAVSTSPSGFQPAGQIQRVQMITNGPGRLTAVREVQIGQTTYTTANNGTLTVVARIADHRLPAGGVVGTLAVSGQTVRLTNTIALPNGSVTNSSWSATSGANGTVTFVITDLATISGACRLAAWWDIGTLNGVLDPDQDAWATHTYPLGTTVELTSTPDVGDDKNTSSAKRARIQVTRSGSTGSSLVVNLTLNTNVFIRPSDSTDLAAKYGTTGTADYYITSGSGTWSTASPYGSGTITIPAGTNKADVQVVTRADDLTEQNVIVARLASATNYAIGLSTNVHVLIFDGPLWSVIPLGSGAPSYTNVTSAAYAISQVNGSTQPRIGGYGTWGYYSGTNFYQTSLGGYWPMPGLAYISQENVVYAGISTEPLNLVGSIGTRARMTRTAGSDFDLPHLSAYSNSAAYGIVSNASMILGTSLSSSNVLKPVRWVGSGSSYSVFDVSSAMAYNLPGNAFSGNSANQVVGELYIFNVGGYDGFAGFRTKSSTSPQNLDHNPLDGAGDFFHAPGQVGVQNRLTRAIAASNSGATVGYYQVDSSGIRRGVYWGSSSIASSATAIDLDRWIAKLGSLADSQASALGVNSSGWIVGWSSTNGTPSRAVFRWSPTTSGKDWVDLNDEHFVSGASYWNALQSATAVSDSGHIIGNGLYLGVPTAFLLVPRTTGN